MKITSYETEIKGAWKLDGKRIVADKQCERIEWLRNSYLLFITADLSGWEILYQDPEDKRYWELTFPHGELQGGGPPNLQYISNSEASKKYNLHKI